jgi:hypothetical protein
MPADDSRLSVIVTAAVECKLAERVHAVCLDVLSSFLC